MRTSVWPTNFVRQRMTICADATESRPVTESRSARGYQSSSRLPGSFAQKNRPFAQPLGGVPGFRMTPMKAGFQRFRARIHRPCDRFDWRIAPGHPTQESAQRSQTVVDDQLADVRSRARRLMAGVEVAQGVGRAARWAEGMPTIDCLGLTSKLGRCLRTTSLIDHGQPAVSDWVRRVRHWQSGSVAAHRPGPRSRRSRSRSGGSWGMPSRGDSSRPSMRRARTVRSPIPRLPDHAESSPGRQPQFHWQRGIIRSEEARE